MFGNKAQSELTSLVQKEVLQRGQKLDLGNDHKRQAEGSVTPDYRDRQKHQRSPSLTPPRRREERSPTYSPPGVQWNDEDNHAKEEGQSKRKGADKLSRSRWANDD